MAYSPTNGLSLNANFITKGIYSPTNGLLLNANFSSDPILSYKALIFSQEGLRQIFNNEIGTGLKPIVIDNGTIKQRSASEGIPVVYKGSWPLATLSDGEELLI